MVYGVIFAGGYGKRLKPLTDEKPKVLLELKKNYTILDKQLMDFKNSGIDHVFLLVGYLWKKIRERYGKHWKGVEIEYLVEKKPMGTLWAMKNCSIHLDDDAVVRNGDTVSDFNIKKMIKYAEESNFYLIIALTRMKSPYAIVDVEDSRIKNFIEKPLLDHYINAGLYYLKKESYPFLQEDYEGKEIERTFFPRIVSLGLAGAFMEDVKWFPVDNYKDLEEVRIEYKNRKDTDFGYVKNFNGYSEIFVKESYSARINTKGSLEIMKGEGKIDGIHVKKGERMKITGIKYYEAKENSLIKITF